MLKAINPNFLRAPSLISALLDRPVPAAAVNWANYVGSVWVLTTHVRWPWFIRKAADSGVYGFFLRALNSS